MFCPNCGAPMPDGSRFCGACGARFESEQDSGNIHITPEPEMGNDANGETAQQRAFSQEEGTQREDPGDAAGRKVSPKLLVIAAIAVAAVFLIVVVLRLLSGGGSGGNAYVYLSDGEYKLLTSLEEGEEIDIASSRDSDQASGLVRFSEDGTYVYYYSKYDESSGTGTLSRAQFGKLKQDSDKNDNYIEMIASNVMLGFSMQDDGTIVYSTGSDDLYYYDGSGDPVQIAKDVEFYYSDGESRLIYEKEEEDVSILYSIDLKDPDTATKLVSDYSNLAYYSILDSIVYTKYGEDDEDSSYYVVDLEGNVTKLGSGIRIYQYNYDDAVDFYYTAQGDEISLYDYVNDDYAEQDADVFEPDKEDYAIPSYSYYKLDSGSDISQYDAVYTSCTVAARFYSSGWSYRSLEYAAQNDDEHAADYQAFVDKYLGQEDEDGYILVTDSVKADLVLLAQTCGDGEDNDWQNLCFYREQTGTTYDYDAYNEDVAIYKEAEDRIAIRQALQDPENAYSTRTLYSYSDGTSAEVAQNLLDVDSNNLCLLYNTADMITEKLELEQLSYVNEVKELFELDPKAANYVLVLGSTSPYQLSESAAAIYADAYEDSYYATFLATDAALYMATAGELYLAATQGSEITSLSLISDDASLAGWDEDVLYYFEGTYNDSDWNSYGDLYSHNGKTGTLLARNILLNYLRLYEDDVILCFTDIADSSTVRGELTMIDEKGNVDMIADDVEQYIRVDEDTILYIADYGTLYVYDGKDSEELDDDVDYIWAMESEDIRLSYMTTY